MANVGDVDDMFELITLVTQHPPQRIGEHISAHIADMLVIIDRRATGIDARLAGVDGREGLKFAGQAVEKAQVSHTLSLDHPGGLRQRWMRITKEKFSMRATPEFDFALGEAADMIRESTARFADEKIAPLAAKVDAEDWFPRDELWLGMGALGLHGITVEEEWGGLGLGYLEHVIAVEEVSRASASVGLSYGAHSNLCVNQIRRWGNEDQKRKYLPKLISGEHVGSLAMSEAGAGSDVVSMKLRADKVDGGWRLNGTKFWITNSAFADTLGRLCQDRAERVARDHGLPDRKGYAWLQHWPEDRQDGDARSALPPNSCSMIASFPMRM